MGFVQSSRQARSARLRSGGTQSRSFEGERHEPGQQQHSGHRDEHDRDAALRRLTVADPSISAVAATIPMPPTQIITVSSTDVPSAERRAGSMFCTAIYRASSPCPW